VTVLDAHAVIAFLTDEPARPRVEQTLRTEGVAVGIGATNNRDRQPLSLADCLALASAKVLERPLATADRPLLDVAVAERVKVIPLPDQWAEEPQPSDAGDRDG